MTDYDKVMEIAEKLGLKGEDKNEFIKREVDQVRQLMDREREEKNRERDE